MKICFKLFRSGIFACFLFLAAGLLFPADRYALIIGNGNYRDRNIASLTNPVNDATDVASVLGKLGYNVTLKTNIGLRDMMNVIREFSGNLRRSSDNEGFFWFAGHGLSVRGIHYMLPVDVDPVDDNIIARGSYSVDDLLEEIGNARNKTNLIVIDACRNTLLPGSGNRTVGSRGLTVLASDDYRISGNKIVYSTMAGRTAADGVPGSRNSPFAQAFISNIANPESFDDVFLDIANETLRLTNGEQQPYSMGSFAVKSYSISPQSAAPAAPGASTASGTPAASSAPSAPVTMPQTSSPTQRRETTDFIMDNRWAMSLGAAPALYGSTFAGGGGGVSLNFTFFERYGPHGKFFLIPNSFFLGIDLFYDTRECEFTSNHNNFSTYYITKGSQEFAGVAWNLGALWKIRFNQSQRFLGNLGFLLTFFTGGGKIYDSADVEIGDFTVPFDPGVGFTAGLSFRITKLISLDFNLVSQIAIPERKLTWDAYDSRLGGDFEIYADSLYPFTISGRLGITFWWPR